MKEECQSSFTSMFMTPMTNIPYSLVFNEFKHTDMAFSLALFVSCRTNRNEISDFLSYALAKPDVWVVTPRQLIEWMKSPVKASEMSAWMDRYGCTGGGKTPKSVETPTMPVPMSSAPLPSPPLTPAPKEAEPSTPSTSVPPETSGAGVKLERPRFNFIG